MIKKFKDRVLADTRSKKLNFEHDGREHYVYRITDYTRKEKQHYYGSHTPPKDKNYDNLIDDFWSYRTSSKYNTLNEDKKDNYKVKIIKVFNNLGDKIIYEAYLHQYFDVKLHNKFWNESNQTPFGFDTTGKIISEEHRRKLTGRKKTPEELVKISKAHKGKIVKNSTKEKIRKALKGNKLSEETKNKIRDKAIGRKWGEHSEETKKLISEKTSGENNHFYNKKHTLENKEKISKSNSGRKNGRTRLLIFKIGNESFEFSRNEFKEYCKENNIPFHSFYNNLGKVFNSNNFSKSFFKYSHCDGAILNDR